MKPDAHRPGKPCTPAARLVQGPLCLLVLLLSACGGGGSGAGGNGGPPPDTSITISGAAQKGQFLTLAVSASPVDAATGDIGTPVGATITDQAFSVEVPKNQLTLLEATGTFTSEIDGTTINLDKPLRVLVAAGTNSLTANINFATTIVAELALRDLASSGVTPSALIAEKNDFTAAVLGMSPGTTMSALNFEQIVESSDTTDPNLQLLILGGGLVEILQSDQFYAGGFQSFLDSLLAAGTLNEAVAVLAALDGLSIPAIYGQAQQYSGYDLPMLIINNAFYVYVCNPGGCSWQEVPEPMVSVAGTSVWEADGRARVYIRSNEPAIANMQIDVSVSSGSAVAGEDFIGFSRTVTIPIGGTYTFVYVDLIIDALEESTEEFIASIEAGASSYPVFQGLAEISLYDGVKGTVVDPASRDATGLDVGVDVTAVCNPVFNMTDDDCLLLDGSETMLAIVAGRANIARTEVDVVADCAALGNCGVDWIVDFFLEATDGVGIVGEAPLGSFVYTDDRVRLPGDTPQPGEANVRLTDDTSLALANDAAENGWDLSLVARIGETVTTTAGNPLPEFTAVPDTVLVGDALFELGVIYEVMTGTDYGCATAQYALNAQYRQPGANAPFASGTICVDYDPGGAAAGPAVMVDGRLNVVGGGTSLSASVEYTVPPGLDVEVEVADSLGNSDVSRGQTFLFYPTSGTVVAINRLHHRGWPFRFVVDALALTPAGVELGYRDMEYVMDVGYSSQDPRSLGILYSNDIYYRGVDGQNGSLQLTQDGITGDFTVAGGPGLADHTAFPRARVEWQGFNQSLVNNVLQATSVAVDEYRLAQSTSCSGPQCVSGERDTFSVAGTMALDGRGYVLGDATNTGAHATPRWGAREDGSHAWTRVDDLVLQSDLKLAVPGYIVPGEIVSDVLVAHLNEPLPSGDIEIHPLGSSAFVDGNFYPTGLTLGPTTYRNTSGQPVVGDGQNFELLGTVLRIDNGVDPAFDLASSVAAKYVIRNAGITGVFNVATGDLAAAAPQFYGYDLDLTRFAVRAVDNELDMHTWIDGRLALKGEAGGANGLDVFFTNLEVDCSARLGNVDLMYESCDGQDNNGNGEIDENCDFELHAWKAETDLFAARFTGNDRAQACAVGQQRFALQHQLHFKALDKPVAFDTTWDPDGTLFAQESGQMPSYRFDRSDESDGFPLSASDAMPDHVQLDAAVVDAEDYGWLELRSSAVGVPFWNAVESDVRIANVERFGEITADPTVVLRDGELVKTDLPSAQRNKDLLLRGNEISKNDDTRELKAEYAWGNTGFEFRLPVYYQPWQLDNGRADPDVRGRQSRFLGRQLTKDLFVLDANAGINFIEPNRTKLSFGASADFTRLEGLEFQVDITDPRSAAAVDSVLQDLGITRGPLFEPALTDLLETVDIVNRLSNRGMEELLQRALETAVREIGEAAAPLTPNNQDPFVTVSEALTQVHSLPRQIVGILEEDIQRPLDNQLAALKIDMRQSLIEAENAILAIQGPEPQDDLLLKIAAIRRANEAVLGHINEFEDIVRVADIQISANLTLAQDLLREALEVTVELNTALNNIDIVLRQATAVVDSACSDGLLIDEEGSGFLTTAAERIAAVRRVADIIRNTNQWLAAAENIAQNEDVKQRLETARQRIQDASEELLGFVELADQAVSQLVCHPDQVDQVVQFAEEFTADIRAEIQTAREQLIVAVLSLNQLREVRDTHFKRMYDWISIARSWVEPTENSASDFPGEQLNHIVSCILYNASHDAECSIALSVPIPPAIAPYGMNALANNAPGERDIVDVLFYVLESEVDGAFETLKTELRDSMDGLLPGSYMTPEQLRRVLVTEIMRSAPVKDLREAMDKHFAEVAGSINGIGLQIVDQINAVVEDALSVVTGPINDALSEATSVVRGIPLQSAGINGFATIAGNELERAHISAGWTMRGGDDDDKTGFKAALDAESWSAKHTNPDVNTPTACVLDELESLLDVKISAYGLPINVMAADIEIEKLYLGFTLENNSGSGPALKPIGVFGGINTIGEIGFSEAIVFDPAFAAGLGTKQTYIGASAGAVFSSLTADVAFLVGRVCPGNSVITDLDPDVEKFLPNLPASGFAGAYLRGGATIPVIPGGCALNVGVVADFGTWIFVGQPTTFGGLVGGGATGQVACIAALKGKVTVGGSASTDGDLKLVGEGWGVAGIGVDCDPGTWTSVPRSREDSWCGTGDAQFGASFDNGKWKVNPPKPSAIH